MTAEQKIAYVKNYLEEKSKDKDFYQDGHWDEIEYLIESSIRESLKQIGIIANIVANGIVLSPYCNSLFREKCEKE